MSLNGELSKCWRYVQLDEVVEINPKAPVSKSISPDLEVSFVPMGAVSEAGFIEDAQVRKYSEVCKGYTSFQENDVLFAKITPCMENGKRAIARNLVNGIGFGSTEFHILRPKKEVLPEYIYHFISRKAFRKEAERNMTGSVGQKRVPTSFLKSVKIPLPPLHIQKEIVQVLDEADALIQKRKQAIAKLDELVQSVFLEMFGDPVSNPKAWKLEKLKKLGTLGRGVSKHRPRNDPKLLGGKYPLVQTGDVARSGIYLYEYNQTYSELGLRQSKMWPKGTLCITIAANIADASILTFDACFPDSVVGFIPERELTNCEYIYCWISHLKRYIEEKAPQVAQKNINLTILSDLDVPVPPINLQNQFAMIVSQIESQKHHMQQQLAKLEENFNSLLQRAFKGELQFRQVGEWDAPQRGFSEAVSPVEVRS